MLNQVTENINRLVPGANASTVAVTIGHSSVTVDSGKLFDVCKALKTEGYNVLQAITATDYPERIELTYILADFTRNLELLLKTNVPRGDGHGNNKETLPKVDSVVSLWSAANYQEREAYDMMGIHFVGHPDHRRILTPDDWQGYPLRKDYIVQEKYLDMVVNPAHKINHDDHLFGKRLKAEIGDPKKVSASWKDSSGAGEEAEEDKEDA